MASTSSAACHAAWVIAAVIRSVGVGWPGAAGPGPAVRPTAGSRPRARPARRCAPSSRRRSAGSWPIAVSPDSITASVPSNTALATSLTSARVGAGASIIDSSIWVAVMTGVPTSTQWRMICFCRWGTSSSGQSMPRSPRATMTASAASAMPARSPSADAVSILATIRDAVADDGAHLLDVARPGARTRAPRSRRRRAATASASTEVVGGRREQREPLARQVHAGTALRAAARLDLGHARASAVDADDPERDRRRRRATTRSPTSTSSTRSGSRRGSTLGVLGPSPATSAHVAAGAELDAPSGNGPARIFGPGRSASTPTDGRRPAVSRARAQHGRGARRRCRG